MEEVMQFYNLGDKTFETDFSLYLDDFENLIIAAYGCVVFVQNIYVCKWFAYDFANYHQLVQTSKRSLYHTPCLCTKFVVICFNEQSVMG